MSLREYLNTDIEIVEGEKDEYLSDILELVFEFIDNSVDIDQLDEENFELLQEILECCNDERETDEIDEARKGKRKKVVRAGKRKRKITCDPGYKAVDGKCVRMSQSERKTREKAQRKAGKKRKQTSRQAAQKRKRSMRKRN